MSFQSPIWLLLPAALILLPLALGRRRLLTLPRTFIILTLGLALANPSLQRSRPGLDLYLLVDRSASTEGLIDSQLPEWLDLLEKSRPSSHHRLHLINYAAEVIPQDSGENATYHGSRQLTRTRLALAHTLSQLDPEQAARFLHLGDGFATEALGELPTLLQEAGVPLDYRLLGSSAPDDYRLARLQTPTQARPGEPFLLQLLVRGPPSGQVPLVLRRNGREIARHTLSLENGSARLEFSDRLSSPGSHRYEAELLPGADPHPGNNRAASLLEITSGPRLLLLTAYQPDPLAESLRQQGFSVETITDPATLTPARLTGTRAVIINNLPAHQIPPAFQDALDFYLREQGHGLLMAGGAHAFGAGGYFQSPLDPLLPVSMELKEDHRKLAVALAIVLDRSGSMSAPAGAGGQNKMDLANNGAAAAIDLLGARDEVAVFAVDTEARPALPLAPLGPNKERALQRVRRIKPGGGGIHVFTGLDRAWQELRLSKLQTKHLILFSDAADSEEPGTYQELLAEMSAEGISVSVIGLGTDKDPDAALLKDIAKLGKGRIFFTDQARELPRLFAQETVTLARSAFLKEPTPTTPTGNWADLSPDPLPWLPGVDAYNLSYARPDATVSLLSRDDYQAPLIAHIRRGLGRSMAISFPLGGEHSARTRAWPQYADFLQTTARWLMGDELPPGLALLPEISGTTLRLDLHYDPVRWESALSQDPPRVKIISGEEKTSRELTWQRLAPGHFSLRHELPEAASLRGVVQIGSHTLPFGPLVLDQAREWAFDPARLAELREVSRLSGGRELLQLSEAWQSPPPRLRASSLRPPLLTLALLLILIDALLTRTGWKLPAFGKFQLRPQPASRQAPEKPTAPAPTPSPESPAETPAPKTSPGDEAAERRSSRFRRAKK